MADNVTLNSMSGGSVVATDDISSVHYQRIKLIEGADGVNDGDISSANGLPVELLASTAAIGKLAANSGVDIGDVTINNSTGASAVNIQDGGNTITVDGTELSAIQTSVELIDDTIKADDAAFTPGTTKVQMAGFEYDDTTPDSVDEGDAGAARMSANRNIYVQIRDAAGNERGLAIDASNRLTALAVQSGTWILGANSGVDIGDVTINNSTGASAVNIQDGGNTITVDNGGTFAVQDSQVIADDAAFTVATSKVFAAGFLADETSTDSVDEGDAGIARMTLDRKQIVTIQPHTAGGWDVKNCTSGDGSTALTNTAQAIKASAGKLGGWYIYNPNSSAAYVPIYNVASGSVTVGTTNPLMVLCIPATSAANLEMVNGITFDTAISAAAATTGAGNTAPSTALDANFFYK